MDDEVGRILRRHNGDAAGHALGFLRLLARKIAPATLFAVRGDSLTPFPTCPRCLKPLM